MGDGTIVFDFVYPGGSIADIELGVPVAINVDNAVAALAAVWLTGTLTPGDGVTAALLSAHGIRVYGEDDVAELLSL